MCIYVYVCFIFIVFFQFGFERQCTYVRTSPWQRSQAWSVNEMGPKWFAVGGSIMVYRWWRVFPLLLLLLPESFSRGMFRRKGCGSPLFRGLALTIRTDPDSPRYFYARMFKQLTLSRRVPPLLSNLSKTLGRRRGRFAWNNGVEKERLRFVYRLASKWNNWIVVEWA